MLKIKCIVFSFVQWQAEFYEQKQQNICEAKLKK